MFTHVPSSTPTFRNVAGTIVSLAGERHDLLLEQSLKPVLKIFLPLTCPVATNQREPSFLKLWRRR